MGAGVIDWELLEVTSIFAKWNKFKNMELKKSGFFVNNFMCS